MTNDQPERDHVNEIYGALLGRPILLDIPTKRKGPLTRGWDQTTWEDTQDPVYQTRLRHGDIGVMLGSASVYEDPLSREKYHLCSIDIDEDSEVEPFLAANPTLRESLMTQGKRGGNIWLWVPAWEYPDMAKLVFADGRLGPDGKPQGWGEWRSETRAVGGVPARRFQTVFWGTHPDGMQYRRVSAGRHPLRLNKFADIVWPESVDVPWRKTAFQLLAEQEGQPWHISKKGVMTLNPPFFVAKFASEHDVLFEPDETRFYRYEKPKGLWVEDSEDAIRWKFSRDFKRVADDADRPELELKRTNSFLQGLVIMLRGAVERRAAFVKVAGIVHLENGMLDLREKEPKLESFDHTFYSRNQIPVKLDEDAKCPRFMGELLENAVDREDIALLQKWAGQLLLGVNLTQKIMLLTGKAGAGKSTFINLMAKLIGQANVAGLRTEHLHQRFELFNYVGKTFLIGADVPGNFLMTEGAHVLKALVGKDVLTAEKKNGESINIVGDFNVGMTSNSRLKVRLDGDGEAYGRRLMIVNYERPAPETPDPLFMEKIFASEASGILNWAIQGAIILLREIETSGRMMMTAKQKDRVDSLLAESDSIRQFVKKGLATAAVDSTVTTHELNEAYVHYCEERGWTPMPQRTVGKMLPDIMLEVHRTSQRNDIGREGKNQRGYKGVRLFTDADKSDARDASASAEGVPRG